MAGHRRHCRPRPGPGWRSAAKKGGAQAQALGRSRGGFGTKLHAVVDALGLPVRFEIGPGQQNDMAPAGDLIAGLACGKVLADRAYDGDSLHDRILDEGGEPVIPPRRHRKYQHRYDKLAYRQRWSVESFFAKLKQWRRIATRYDKLAANFIGFVKIASIMMWLAWSNRHYSLENFRFSLNRRNSLNFCFYAIPNAKPLGAFAGIALTAGPGMREPARPEFQSCSRIFAAVVSSALLGTGSMLSAV